MATYRLELRVTDLELGELPEMPLWDDVDLDQMLGSFHEWMRYSLTDEQRRGVRWTLRVLD